MHDEIPARYKTTSQGFVDDRVKVISASGSRRSGSSLHGCVYFTREMDAEHPYNTSGLNINCVVDWMQALRLRSLQGLQLPQVAKRPRRYHRQIVAVQSPDMWKNSDETQQSDRGRACLKHLA